MFEGRGPNMVEEKKDPVVSLRRHLIGMRWMSHILIAAGAVIIAGAIGYQNGTDSFTNSKHLTTPNIPLKDSENATYSWTAHDLNEHSKFTFLFGFLLGAAILFAGYVPALTVPSQKKVHKASCKGSLEWKYCPECGMNLNELKDD